MVTLADRVEIDSIQDLRDFVSHTLCQQNDFQVGIFQVNERLLTRRGKPCGLLFSLHGPRAVILTAVWETDKNTLNFYGSTGEKLSKTKLTQAPELAAN